MLSVIIPTLDAAARLPACLAALAPGAIDGLVKELVVVDGGSTDASCAIADDAGARVLTSAPGRGVQLIAGAAAARAPWLLFLHADTVLSEDWVDAARAHAVDPSRVGVFRLRFDDADPRARLVEAGARFRARTFGVPYGDQGLLIARPLYDALGGYRPWPLFEDVDIMERLCRAQGRKAIAVLPATALTGAERYRRDGYFRQAARNAARLIRYKAGADPAALARGYE